MPISAAAAGYVYVMCYAHSRRIKEYEEGNPYGKLTEIQQAYLLVAWQEGGID